MQPERADMSTRKPYETTAYGIRNPYGSMWTGDTFPTPEAAAKHVRDFWGDDATRLRGYHVVPVRIIVEDVSCKELPAIPVNERHHV